MVIVVNIYPTSQSPILQKKTIQNGSETFSSNGDTTDDDAIKNYGIHYLRKEQDQDLEAFKIRFDVFSLESSFYSQGKIKDVVTTLKNNGHTYEKDGALWLKTTAFGDDKDRVMQKK